MFGKSRQTLLEEAFIQHMDKEKDSFKHLIDALENIKDEIHKTNTQMSEYNASQKLALMETKTEIFRTVFERMVEKNIYDPTIKELKSSIKNQELALDNKIDKKVSKTEVKTVWATIVIICSFFSWYIGNVYQH